MANTIFECKLSDFCYRDGYINKTIFIKAKCTSAGDSRLKYLHEYKTAYKDVSFIYIGNSRVDNEPMFQIINNTGYDIIVSRNYTIWEDKESTPGVFVLSDVNLLNGSSVPLIHGKNEKFNKYKLFEL